MDSSVKRNGWVARAKNGTLYLWYGGEDKKPKKDRSGITLSGKPVLEFNTWSPYTGREELPTEYFPEITFDNSPVQVEILINAMDLKG